MYINIVFLHVMKIQRTIIFSLSLLLLIFYIIPLPSYGVESIPLNIQNPNYTESPNLPAGPGMPGSPGMPGTPKSLSVPIFPFENGNIKGTQFEKRKELFTGKTSGGEKFIEEERGLYPEETSSFERYISQRLDITPIQLSILKLQPGIKFYITPPPSINPGEKVYYLPDELGGGFISGSQEDLSEAFKIAGIESSLYISTEIKQFGYDMFERSAPSFTPVDTIPVGPEYVIGPGDEIKIAIWGKVNIEYSAVIDKDGKVNLPTVGVIHLAGLTYKVARDLIEKEYGKYFNDIKINITLGKLRSITVFVVGNVKRPGSYTLSPFSTIINALYAAGGPTKAGTLRNIQLKRNGQTVVSFDLYDFLLKGDKTKDIRLMPEDVVLVPPVGPLVAIAGNVKVPAIYEIKEETHLLDLINMAGGTNSIAFKNRLQLIRIEGGNQRIVERNLSVIEESGKENFLLRDGDIIKIFSVSQIADRIVHVTGAVKLPGTYGYSEGMTVKDLVTYAGGLLRYASLEEAELTRITITQKGPKTKRLTIRLKEALAGNPDYNLPLREDDYLFVKTVPEWELYRTVKIYGEVKYPGTYTIKKGETISSLIERAGGFTKEAYLKGAIFTRESVRKLQQKQLDEAINRLEQEMISQSARTIETALTPEEAQQEKIVAEQRRDLIAKMRAARAKGIVSIKLAKLDTFKGSPYDIPLEDGDTLYVPEKPHQIQVIGAVYNPTAFVYNPAWTVDDYIKYAGGFTRNAEDEDIYILKMDGTAVLRKEWGGVFNIKWDSHNNRWIRGGFMTATLDPGDTIVVPEKIERVVWLREIKDLTQILYQIAVTAGVLIVAF